MSREIKYAILKEKKIQSIDLNRKLGRYKVYLTDEKNIRYNYNKFFFQFKKGIIKFRGNTPKEIEGYTTYNQAEILKIVNSTWGQWKLN